MIEIISIPCFGKTTFQKDYNDLLKQDIDFDNLNLNSNYNYDLIIFPSLFRKYEILKRVENRSKKNTVLIYSEIYQNSRHIFYDELIYDIKHNYSDTPKIEVSQPNIFIEHVIIDLIYYYSKSTNQLFLNNLNIPKDYQIHQEDWIPQFDKVIVEKYSIFDKSEDLLKRAIELGYFEKGV